MLASNDYKIRGRGPGYMDFPATGATLQGDNTLTTTLESRGKMPAGIAKLSPEIRWQISSQADPPVWVDAGTTSNVTYVTNIDLQNPVLHTVLDIGCRAFPPSSFLFPDPLAFLNTRPEFVAMTIWNRDFRDPTGGVKRADGTAMQYWGPGATANVNDQSYLTPAGLIKHADGRCEAWADLCWMVMATQGVLEFDQVAWTQVKPMNAPGFDVYQNLPGQGTSPPGAWRFNGHALVTLRLGANVEPIILDPSYGRAWSSRLDGQGNIVTPQQAWQADVVEAPAGLIVEFEQIDLDHVP